MDPLRIAHQFFHFSALQWQIFCDQNRGNPEPLGLIFSRNLFAKRALCIRSPESPAEALDLFREIEEQEMHHGIRAISFSSPEYPEQINHYIPPERRPAILYCRGKRPPAENECIGIVGTRNPTAWGKINAESFSSFFSAHRIQILSGLARGIDTIAHRRGLEAQTVAVLGASLQEIYPKENTLLAEEILRNNGTLLSPFPLRQVPLPQNFPQRNEIIAALSSGILVVEGKETSGASITGKQALAMGKAVVALTQDFRNPYGRGAIRLFQMGAHLVCSEQEAAEALFSRLGGVFPHKFLGETKTRKIFSLADFMAASNQDPIKSLAILQEGISIGRIEKLGENSFRWKNTKHTH